MLQFLLLVLGCAPVYTMPGPTGSVGKERVRTRGPWLEDEGSAAVAAAEVDSQAEDRRTRRARAVAGPERGGEGVAAAAVWYIGKSTLSCKGENYRYDCSGFVDAAHARAGIDLGHKNTAALFALADKLGVDHDEPRIGDAVFFDDTYDRNKNGRLDDALSHIAIVEDIDDDGTMTLVHKGSKGVVRIWMNLDHPDEALSPEGKTWNSWLRARTRSDPRGTQYLSGQMYRGAASFWASDSLDVDAQVEG